MQGGIRVLQSNYEPGGGTAGSECSGTGHNIPGKHKTHRQKHPHAVLQADTDTAGKPVYGAGGA